MINWDKFFQLRRFELWSTLMLLITGCATFEQPTNQDLEVVGESETLQRANDSLKENSEPEIQSLEPIVGSGESLKVDNELSKPRSNEGRKNVGLGAGKEATNSTFEPEADLTALIKLAYEAQIKLKERLVTELEQQLVIKNSEVDGKIQSVEKLVSLLGATDNLLAALEAEVKKYAQLDVNGALVNPLAKERVSELEREVRDLRREVPGC